MAIRRPLRWDTATGALKEMSDSDLALLAYYARYHWAQEHLATYTANAYRDGSATATNGFGAPYRTNSTSATDANYTHHGAYNDTRKTPSTLSNADNDEPQSQPNAFAGDDDDSFGVPSEASFNDTLATAQTLYKETYDNATAPSNPSTSDHNSHGYMIWDSSGYVKVEYEVANIADTVIKLANAAMLSGDKVGTYYISTSDPSEGTGHTWSDLGTFIEDTISTYSFPTTTGSSIAQAHKLWLKTDAPLDSVESSVALTSYMQWSSSGDIGLKQVDKGSGGSTFSNIATNIIIPIWKNNSALIPKYKFSASNTLAGSWEALKGTYSDTYYDTSQTTGPTLDSSTYYSARYGLATTTVNTEYMIMYIGSDATSYR